MRIGIIGAQSMHAVQFGKLFQCGKHFGNARISSIWGGDEPSKIHEVMDAVGIETCYDRYEKVIENSDAVIIVTRLGDTHLEPALYAINKEKPLFVDKPFSVTTDDAKKMVKAAVDSGVPLTAGSTLCFLPDVSKAVESSHDASFISISYYAEPGSPFGGYRFYLSHLTDLCSVICGEEGTHVFSTRCGDNISSLISYPGKQVLLHTNTHCIKPVITFCGDKITTIELSDEKCYLRGMTVFMDSIKTAKPQVKYSRLIYSVRLMSAIYRSLDSGAKEII